MPPILTRAWAWIGEHALLLGAGLLLIGCAYLLGRCDGGRSATHAADQASIKTQATATASADKAADERANDTQRITNEQEARDDAIANASATDRAPSAASNALNCERLRRAGRDTKRISACN